MKMNYNRLVVVVLLCFFSCQEDVQFELDEVPCEGLEFKANTSIATVKSLFSYRGPVQIDTDLIIEGYVVSNDRAGNFYKSVSIQDKPENPTAAISIGIDASNLYAHFDVGRKVLIKLKGLAVGIHYGRLQIGQIVNGEMSSVSAFEYKNHIYRSCEVVEMVPLEVSLEDISESHLDMLLTFPKAQFNEIDKGKTFGDPASNKSIDRSLDCFGTSCEYLGTIPIRTSGFADFKNMVLPNEQLQVQGVLQNYYKEYQLVLRNAFDILEKGDRCSERNWIPNFSLLELVHLYEGKIIEFGNHEDIIVEGYIVSSDEDGNFQNKIVIQDSVENPTAGLQILIDGSQNFEMYELGEKIVLKLNSLYLDNYEGNLSVGLQNNETIEPINKEELSDYIYGSNEIFEIIPTEHAIDEILDKAVKQTLVKIVDVQLDSLDIGKAFAYYSGDDDGIRSLISCGLYGGIKVFTNGEAIFASEKFPTEKGSIIGVLGTHLELRNSADFEIDAPHQICEPFIPLIVISEIADPVNNVGARFVELHNVGEIEISLSGWKLEKFQNGSLNASSGAIDLSGIVMAPNSFVVIANTNFNSIFELKATLVSSYLSGNGDDNYQLVDSFGNVVDVFGVVGEDGTGENWEYLDGQAVRKSSVKKPSKIFDFREWIISSKANNFLINHPNTPKYAPKDFLPFSE